MNPAPETLLGGCHCGAVRFSVVVRAFEATRCNCSICVMKGIVHLIVSPEDFTLLQGDDAIVEYRFNTRVAVHRFCRHCGIHAFYTPRSHPDHVDVNICCLDDVAVERFTVTDFDGRQWEKAIDTLAGATGR